jgi:Rps23 Pro-64 3,4-dihydroxylase Tpa1-like proline 4-hydroxylase
MTMLTLPPSPETSPPLAPGELTPAFDALADRADELARQFQAGQPYPHVVIDDFLPPAVAERLEADFPPTDADVWYRFPSADQVNKLQLSAERHLPDSLRTAIHEFNSGQFLAVVERITGIANLVPDPKLHGGGLHQISAGGRLDVHIDYSHHPGNRLCRRLNLIVYLNPDWREEYGGHFELWDAKVTRCETRVLPVFNRAVIFATTPKSYHGHPEPITCPPDRTRKSIALYYYTNGRPEEPGPVVEHNTLFTPRPGDPFSLRKALMRAASSNWLRDLFPPVIYRPLRAWHNRRQHKATG